MSMIEVAECLTADDVRANAKVVQARLVAARNRKETIAAKYPPPEPKQQTIEDKEIVDFVLSNPDFKRLIISEIRRKRTVKPTIKQIRDLVCEKFGITTNDITGTRRLNKYVHPRQIAYLLCDMLTGASLPMIGRQFNKDHTTILYGVRKLDALRKNLQATLTPNHPIEVWVDEAIRQHELMEFPKCSSQSYSKSASVPRSTSDASCSR